jgi:DNA-binding IclR family transcriptional regulator
MPATEILRGNSVSGTQTIARASMLLRMIARTGIEGARLTYLKQSVGLPHPTVRRMLKCLIEERLVVQNETTRRYLLGPLNFELGLATTRDNRGEGAVRDIIRELAQLTGDTVYLMARSGAELVCIDRAEGDYAIRVHLFSVGGRRPLGFAAAGQALLACMDDASIEAIIERNERELGGHRRLTKEKIWEGIERARTRGFAISTDVYTVGISSIGIAIPVQEGTPVYAINVSTVGAERFERRRVDQIVERAKALIEAMNVETIVH